ncbi:hypothetical protein WA026_002284 [Henosepilachna vigintioctopunctata]|uniref:Reverse transcriptase domain-containing protein n=1 Tax=Henosepilachna vigintioctopunctata TaxID=420089 RepID=A0AAW1TZB2_9CUCU
MTPNHGDLVDIVIRDDILQSSYSTRTKANREQRAPLTLNNNSVILSEEVIKQGVPQSSIPGPILFVIYINDLSTPMQPIIYADDTIIFVQAKHAQAVTAVVKQALTLLEHWCMSRESLLLRARDIREHWAEVNAASKRNCLNYLPMGCYTWNSSLLIWIPFG